MRGSSEQGPPDETTVADYLSGRLDQIRAEAFELYCLRHPDYARRVELDLLLKVGFRQTQALDRALRTRHRRRFGWAIAAGLTLVVACALLLVPRVHLGSLSGYRSVTEIPSPLLSGPRVSITLIRLREGSAVHQVIAPPQAGILAIRVAPDSPPGRLGYAMRVELEQDIRSRSVTRDGLLPDSDGYVEMYLPLAALVGHTLRITVNPSPFTGTDSSSFRLQVAQEKSAPAGE